MAVDVAPGVFTKIIDLSTYLQDIPGTLGYIPFFSRTGPDNELRFVSSLTEFAELYGRPNINDFGKSFGQGPYVAWNHITVSPSFYAMRVLPDDATFSNLFINFNNDSTGSVTVTHENTVNSVSEIDTVLSGISDPTYPMVAIYGLGRGDAYDDFGISVSRSANVNLTGVHVVDIWRTQSDGDDEIIESFEVSFDPESTDDSGDSLFIEDVINRFSKYVRVSVNDESINEYLKFAIDVEVGDAITPVHLSGGSEGSLVTVDPITGKRTVDSVTAIQTLSDAYLGLINDDVIDLDDKYFPLVYDAGYPTEVKNSIVTLVSDIRKDGVAILDNGDNATYSDSIFARENDHTYNTFYAAIFESYSKVFDEHTGKDIFFTPVYHMASMIPLNDKLFNIWYPNAGLNRGTIDGIKELRFSPVLSQRNNLYLKQINPIVKFTVGYAVFSNLTTQLRPSALQDLSIVRTILYIKRALEQFLKFFIFEFNDAETHNTINESITPFLEAIRSSRGLTSFSVDVGATEYEIKQKIAHVDIQLQPTRAIERIELNLFIR